MAWTSLILNSGLTANRMSLARLLARFPSLARLLRLRLSPELLSLLNLLGPTPENGLLYASAATWMRTGRVMKTVGLDRNALADSCVIRLARSRAAVRLCDIGVSDGSASLRLLEAFPGGRIRLFDKYTFFQVRPRPFGSEIYTADGERIYRRLGPVLLYTYDTFPARSAGRPLRRLPVKNPLLSRFAVEIEDFDFFRDEFDGRFDVIKCCNCLNLEFYPGEKLASGIRRLARGLEEGGHLVVGQNHAAYPEGEAYFVLRRSGEGTVLVEERNRHRLLGWLRAHDPGILGGAAGTTGAGAPRS